MPIPQVNDRIKEAPVVVLRAVFAGIGQLLLTADKVRTRAAEQVWTPEQPAGPGPAGPSASWSAATTMTAPAVTAPAGKVTATTRPAPAAKATATTKTARTAKATAATQPAPTGQPASTGKPASPAKPAPAAKPDRAATAVREDKATRTAEVPAAEPPLPGYDDLSLPSLRARLRTLDAPAIEAMLAYEKAHARRDDVTTMLERRLAKITTQ
jgi:hypothetical protein